LRPSRPSLSKKNHRRGGIPEAHNCGAPKEIDWKSLSHNGVLEIKRSRGRKKYASGGVRGQKQSSGKRPSTTVRVLIARRYQERNDTGRGTNDVIILDLVPSRVDKSMNWVTNGKSPTGGLRWSKNSKPRYVRRRGKPTRISRCRPEDQFQEQNRTSTQYLQSEEIAWGWAYILATRWVSAIKYQKISGPLQARESAGMAGSWLGSTESARDRETRRRDQIGSTSAGVRGGPTKGPMERGAAERPGGHGSS